MKSSKQWQGELLLAQGWAHYHGLAGDTTFHAHYPVQLVFSEACDATVTLDDRQITGRFLDIPSNAKHMLAPSQQPLNLLYIEPTLLEGNEGESRALPEWLSALRRRKATIDDTRMIRALEAIDDGLGGKVTQDMVACAAGMSKSSFTKLFRAIIGMPLRRYVLWRRLNVAVAEIGAGADATQAAHKAGFADSAHFSRTMRETFGVSPTDSVLKIQMTVAETPAV
ncbi:helix-turn-helix transcriptional regulator [Kordiimonas lipolytica]|uniref:Helix-turn-helix transcriptional regulator n=1 Tax=Kordiimonas lipolytica TaxID=1662421 RepID=A0ABV8U6Z9_9PROT|nr:AraC family transcriptional regulator [Kordiimonas lipolytica]